MSNSGWSRLLVIYFLSCQAQFSFYCPWLFLFETFDQSIELPLLPANSSNVICESDVPLVICWSIIHVHVSGVSDRTYPCLTASVLLNHSPAVPLNTTPHVALLYNRPVFRTRLSVLYFLIMTHKASCHTLSKAFLTSIIMIAYLCN